MQLLPMASSPDGLISARDAVITKTPRPGGGRGNTRCRLHCRNAVAMHRWIRWRGPAEPEALGGGGGMGEAEGGRGGGVAWGSKGSGRRGAYQL